jgi:hypothetical protein
VPYAHLCEIEVESAEPEASPLGRRDMSGTCFEHQSLLAGSPRNLLFLTVDPVYYSMEVNFSVKLFYFTINKMNASFQLLYFSEPSCLILFMFSVSLLMFSFCSCIIFLILFSCHVFFCNSLCLQQ